MLERKGGALALDVSVKDEKKSNRKDQESAWKKRRNPEKMGGNRRIDVDAAPGISGGHHEALWNEDEDDIQRQECNDGMHRACGIGFRRQ